MFETAELGQSLTKKAFATQSKALRVELLKVQKQLLRADWPVIILIGGVDGAGKGEVMNRLFDWMDAKGLIARVTDTPTQDERERPTTSGCIGHVYSTPAWPREGSASSGRPAGEDELRGARAWLLSC